MGFEYSNSSKNSFKWCNEYTIPTSIYESINLEDVTESFDLARTKFNGKSQTDKILSAAADNNKPSNYFPAANFCKSFAP